MYQKIIGFSWRWSWALASLGINEITISLIFFTPSSEVLYTCERVYYLVWLMWLAVEIIQEAFHNQRDWEVVLHGGFWPRWPFRLGSFEIIIFLKFYWVKMYNSSYSSAERSLHLNQFQWIHFEGWRNHTLSHN